MRLPVRDAVFSITANLLIHAIQNIEPMSDLKEKLLLNIDKGNNLFLSIEPQVGDIWAIDLTYIGWVIQGGESGHNKREFQLQWAYDMKRMCKEQKTPYFFKQIDKIQAIPLDLQIREFPLMEVGSAVLAYNVSAMSSGGFGTTH